MTNPKPAKKRSHLLLKRYQKKSIPIILVDTSKMKTYSLLTKTGKWKIAGKDFLKFL